MTTISKSKQGKKRRCNNERWYCCSKCQEFKFAVYVTVWKKPPFCPRCGENRYTRKIQPPTFSMRENYKPWTKEDLLYLEDVMSGKIGWLQCELELDRSLSSIQNKVRRIQKRRKENANH